MNKCKIYCMTVGEVLDGFITDRGIDVAAENGETIPYSHRYPAYSFENGLGSFSSEDGLWGIFARSSSQILVQPVWDFALPLGPNIIMIKREGKFGLVDLKGNVLVEPVWDKIEHHTPAMIVQKDGHFGVIDGEGKIVIDPTWDEIKRFKSNHIPGRYSEFAVKKGKKWGLYDSKGVLVLNPVFDDILMSCKVLACDENLTPILFKSVMFGQKATSNVFVNKLGHIMNPAKDLYDQNSLSWFYVVFNGGYFGLADIHGQIFYDHKPFDKNAPAEPPSDTKNRLVWATQIPTSIGAIYFKLWRVLGTATWDAKLYFSVQKDLRKKEPPAQKGRPANVNSNKTNNKIN